MGRCFGLLLVILACATGTLACDDVNPPGELATLPAGTYAWFDTNRGQIVARLFTDRAPIAVASFTGLANGQQPFYDIRKKRTRQGHYFDGLIFHRVVKDFAIQGGDPNANGTGGPGYRFRDELSPDLKFDREGMLALANSGPDTNGSQFFFTLKPQPDLDGKYTIFGEVVAGMEVVEAIGDSPINRFQPERPIKEVKIRHIRVFEKAENGNISEAGMSAVEGLPQAAAPTPRPMATPLQPPAE